MTIESWLLPSIIALVFNGVTTFLPKISLRSLRVLDLIVYHTAFFFLCAMLVQPFFGPIEFEWKSFIIAMMSGVFGTMGQLLYLLALQRGPLTQVSMISALYPLVATILAFVVLHEPLSLRQAAGVLLGILSIILLMMSNDNDTAKQ